MKQPGSEPCELFAHPTASYQDALGPFYAPSENICRRSSAHQEAGAYTVGGTETQGAGEEWASEIGAGG
jgi:hypothetical protein